MPTSKSGYIRISSSHIVLEYENVFDCKAEIIAGHGVASVNPSLQEVVEGDSCTFTVTMQSGWAFEGWYDNPDFTGTKLSSSASYTINNITAKQILDEIAGSVRKPEISAGQGAF